MQFECRNSDELIKAVKMYERSPKGEPMILIFRTPGGQAHRFIVARHGVEREDCDKTGSPRED